MTDPLSLLSDGATILVGGFGDRGIPYELINQVIDTGVRNLCAVSVNAGSGDIGMAKLIAEGRVEKIVCSFPRTSGSVHFEEAYADGRIALELVPMGTLVARLQAAASGTPAFFSSVGAHSSLAQGKERRFFNGKEHVLEYALSGDLGLVRAHAADPWHNLLYRGTDRNLNPLVARAATVSVAEVDDLLDDPMHPERVETPGVYIANVVKTTKGAQ